MDIVRKSRMKRWGVAIAALSIAGTTAACSSTPKTASTTTTSASSAASVPAGLSVKSFDVTFSEMAKFKPLDRGRQGPGGRHPPGHHFVDPVRQLRRPVSDQGVPAGRVQLV